MPLKLSFVLILIAFTCALGALDIAKSTSESPLLSQTKPTADANREKTKTGNDPPPTEIESGRSISQPATNKEKQTTSQSKERWYDFLWQTNLPNWIVIIGWGIAAVIAWFSLGAVKRQADIASAGITVAQDAAKAAQKSADVAHQQVQIMATSERPWMMMQVDKWDESPTVHNPQYGFGGVLEWSIINVGKSPAFLTDLVVVVDTVPYPIVDQRPEYPTPHAFAKFIIPPNGKHRSKTPKPIDAAVMPKIFDGTWCKIFYGLIGYRDSLGETHQTRFCSYWHMTTIFAGKNVSEKRDWLFEPVGPPSYIEYT